MSFKKSSECDKNIDLHSKLKSSLRDNSRTFYLPVMRLTGELRTAVASSYLCMRAIDEIEDHPELPLQVKSELLSKIAVSLTDIDTGGPSKINKLFGEHAKALSPVTLDIDFWLESVPGEVAPRAFSEVSSMSERMGYWAERGWRVNNVADLERYTFAVAGAVGLLLNDLFSWYAHTSADYRLAVEFGRGLQAVNILLNRSADLPHGRDFYPPGWENNEMHEYALDKLAKGKKYLESISDQTIREAFDIPLQLAYASLEIFMSQNRKLTREEVNSIFSVISNENS